MAAGTFKSIYMDPLLIYVVLVIVTWRLTHLISNEDGPFELILKIRKLMGASFLGQLMDCFYCLSIWIGLGLSLYVSRDPALFIPLTLYYSGTAILLEKLTNKTFV